MSVLYLMTAPRPRLEGTDAVVQEAETLKARFGGAVVHTALSPRPWARFPRALYGVQKAWSLKRLERNVDIVHVYHAELFAFPILRLLRKPLVYSVVCGLGGGAFAGIGFLRRLSAIVVPTDGDLRRLRQLGVAHGHLATAGVDLTKFELKPIPRGDQLVLMSGSAPWTREQFYGKGLDALLEVTQQLPFLRLVLLWRGWLVDELRRRVAALGLADRVEVLAERVDVNEVLGRVHAAVVLAEEPRLVKAYPQSLLEALACGRPVVVSDGIAMASHVEETGCGRVVKGVNPDDLAQAIRSLRQDYSSLQANARRVGQRDFPVEKLVEDYRSIYASVLDLAAPVRGDTGMP